MNGMAALLMVGVFYVGLYPQQLFEMIDHATSYLFV
jgi:NADH:ubiquinone oxidoreductase subunit 4 (subunit M)